MNGDEELEYLRRALAPDPGGPPPSSIVHLHAAVAARFKVRAKITWRKARLPVAAAAFFAVLSGSATAFALSGGGLPGAFRAALHDIGLPVDSPAVADAKSAESRLRTALQQRNSAAVIAAAADLRDDLARLHGGDWRQIAPGANSLLQQAHYGDSQVRPTAPATGAPVSRTPSRPDTSDPPEGPDSTPPGGQPDQTTTTTGANPTDRDGDSGPTTTTPSGNDSASPAATTTTAPTVDGDGGGTPTGGSNGDSNETTTTTTGSGP